MTGSVSCAGSPPTRTRWLKPGGVLLVEVGTYLSRRTQSVLRAAHLIDVSWAKDSLGVTRVVSGARRRSYTRALRRTRCGTSAPV